MFSYRHAFHAGSHADILKHMTLIHLVDYLQEKPGALTIIDTHAGAGIYSLEDGFAAVSKEADGGIFRLQKFTIQPVGEWVSVTIRADPGATKRAKNPSKIVIIVSGLQIYP